MSEAIVDVTFEYTTQVVPAGRRKPVTVKVRDTMPVPIKACDRLDCEDALRLREDFSHQYPTGNPRAIVHLWSSHDGRIYQKALPVPCHGDRVRPGSFSDRFTDDLAIMIGPGETGHWNSFTRGEWIEQGIRSWNEDDREACEGLVRQYCTKLLLVGPDQEIVREASPPRWCLRMDSRSAYPVIRPHTSGRLLPEGIVFPWKDRELLLDLATSLAQENKAGVIEPLGWTVDAVSPAHLAVDDRQDCILPSIEALAFDLMHAVTPSDFPGLSREALNAWSNIREVAGGRLEPEARLEPFLAALKDFIQLSRPSASSRTVARIGRPLILACERQLFVGQSVRDDDLEVLGGLAP